jgi:3-oxoacyl-[acyl-carrier-protein] synthase II
MPSNWTDRRVVVTGLGVVTPLGHGADVFWKHLVSGQCGIDRITAFDPAGFDTQIAGEVKDFDPAPAFPSPKDVRRTDRYSQFGVHAAWQALQDCGAELDKLNGDEIGVIIGSGIGGLETTTAQLKILLERGPGRLSPREALATIRSMKLGLERAFGRGP